ncbi:MAG: ribonuclease E/G, partial [Rhodospirillaceae bacterium]
RLRNLAGLMIIDFVTMRRDENKARVLAALNRAFADDPQRPFIGGFTRFGLVEMTRRRKGPSLTEQLCGGPATPVKSPLTTALEALRTVLAEAAAAPAAAFVLELPPDAAKALNDHAEAALGATRDRLGGGLAVEVNPTMRPDGYAVRAGTRADE